MTNVAALQCRNVVLRPFETEDIELLYQWRNQLNDLALWSSRRYPIGREDYEREFQSIEARDTHIRMMIDINGNTVGSIHTYGYNAMHNWAYVCTFLAPEAKGNGGIGPIAFGLFVNYLFDNFPFRRLYNEVFDYNRLSKSTMAKAGLELVTTIPNHLFWKGKYHDWHLFMLEREDLHIVHNFLSRMEPGSK